MKQHNSPSAPTYFYLQQKSEAYSKFLMFHNYSPNQMLIEIYGLNGQKALMTHEFLERILTENELSSVNFQWPDAIEVDEPIEHITCHQDGYTFQIKTQNKKNLYTRRMKHTTPIGPNVDTFLNFEVISKLASKYSTLNETPSLPNVTFPVKANKSLFITGVFAGSRYPLENEFVANIQHRLRKKIYAIPLLLLTSGTIKGAFWCRTRPVETHQNKPPGTLMIFRFPIDDQKYAFKAFFFK